MTKSRASDRSSRYTDLALRVVVALYFLVAIAMLWRAVAVLGLKVPLDPNEGWNAYHALAAMSGGTLYPDVRSYFVDNYPPLSFYVVGLLGRMVGDNIVAGRIISLASFLVVGFGVLELARLMGCRLREALLAAFLLAAWLLVGSDYVGMDDPQLLGHALDIAALLLLSRSGQATWISALFFVLAFFVKHNLVALPLAAAAWLFLCERVRARRLIAFVAGFMVIGFLSFRLIYGSNLLVHLFSARIYSFDLLISNTAQWLAWSAVPIALTVVLMALHPKDKFAIFCAIYAGVAIVLGITASGGAGVDTNAFFDADIALSLGAGVALNKLSARGSLPLAFATASLLIPLLAGLYLAYDGEWSDPDFWLHPMAQDADTSARDIVFLGDHKGPALCETLSFCYWAGKKVEVDVFNVGQEFATRARSDDDLVRRVRTHAFAAIEFDSLNPFSLTPGIRAALLDSYRIDHSDDDGVFLVPR